MELEWGQRRTEKVQFVEKVKRAANKNGTKLSDYFIPLSRVQPITGQILSTFFIMEAISVLGMHHKHNHCCYPHSYTVTGIF